MVSPTTRSRPSLFRLITASGSVASVTGSATYNGDALGVYVKNVFDSEGTIETATSGHFTADVTLTATFKQTVDDSDTDNVNEAGQIAPNLLDTLKGSIGNFELAGGESQNWAVNLDGEINDGEGTASGPATGGGTPGTFTATFHGPTTDADNNNIAPQQRGRRVWRQLLERLSSRSVRSA